MNILCVWKKVMEQDQNQKPKRLRPFIYWTGGKSRNMSYIARNYPRRPFTTYVEPFLGSGVVMMDIITKYQVKNIIANDINKELINTFEQVRDNCDDVIERYLELEKEYIEAASQEDGQKNMYYNKRKAYNEVLDGKIDELDDIDIAALFIFLNRTCKDGSYRVNRQGFFTTAWNERAVTEPMLNMDELREISKVLKPVKFTSGSYDNCLSSIDEDTFVYLDPPYIFDIDPSLKFKNVSVPYCTEPFTSQSFDEFKEFVEKVHDKGASILITIPARDRDNEKDKVKEMFKDYRIKEFSVGRPDENGVQTRFEYTISNY